MTIFHKRVIIFSKLSFVKAKIALHNLKQAGKSLFKSIAQERETRAQSELDSFGTKGGSVFKCWREVVETICELVETI